MGGSREMIAVEKLSTIYSISSLVTPVGSRVTCSPAPVGTDEDYLVLITPENIVNLEQLLFDCGWEVGGSVFVGDTTIMEGFKSWKLGDLNIIATASIEWHNKFMLAARVSTNLNLLIKQDRIALFQAILYGVA